jgi:hypothetical protein
MRVTRGSLKKLGKRVLLPGLFIVFTNLVQAQQKGDVSTDKLRMSLFQIQGGFQIPYGDMGEIYGVNANVGFSYAYKSTDNILLGADFNFLFGNTVKDEDMLMQELRNSTGAIIGIEGEAVNFLVLERGFSGGFYVGKIFPIIGPNPNSGLMVRIGAQYLEHRTWIEARETEIPPIEGDYRKGYDRKRAGIALYQFIGYQNFSDNRLANFFVGFDFYQGFTTDYRSYNFDEMDFTDNDYFDVLIGFKVGWVLPVYRQEANKFYIN